jgi:hypothetical protein
MNFDPMATSALVVAMAGCAWDLRGDKRSLETLTIVESTRPCPVAAEFRVEKGLVALRVDPSIPMLRLKSLDVYGFERHDGTTQLGKPRNILDRHCPKILNGGKDHQFVFEPGNVSPVTHRSMLARIRYRLNRGGAVFTHPFNVIVTS